MSKRLRLVMSFAVLIAVFYVLWDVTIVRDAALWIVLMYLVIGSVTGGTKVLVSQFTKKPTGAVRYRLGISWVVLTLWLLRVVFGVVPAGSSEQRPDEGKSDCDGNEP